MYITTLKIYDLIHMHLSCIDFCMDNHSQVNFTGQFSCITEVGELNSSYMSNISMFSNW